MIEVRAAPPEHYDWIRQRCRIACGPTFFGFEAIEGERIVGMIGFDGWTPNAVMLHIALDEPTALRRLLRPAAGIVFCARDAKPRGFDKDVITASVLSTNERSLALVKHLGFREVMRGRDWWAPGVDMVWHEMRREECRFISAAERERKTQRAERKAA